jgi:hypothetical protein
VKSTVGLELNLQEKTTGLGGKMIMVVEAFNHRPIAVWYNSDAKVNDKTFANQLLARLPQQGLLIMDNIVPYKNLYSTQMRTAINVMGQDIVEVIPYRCTTLPRKP